MRMDQHMGLNAFAQDLVTEIVAVTEKGTRIWPNGKREKFKRKVQIDRVKSTVVNHYNGMYNNEHDLRLYTLPNGRRYMEFVQARPWSSGPVFFLALLDEYDNSVTESLWSQEEIDNA